MTLAESLSPEKRAQILDGAGAVFASDGYEGASMSRISAEAGVSKGTLYNYFPSKAALFAAYVGQQCERNLSRTFDGADHDGDPAAVLRGIGIRMVRLLSSQVGVTIYRVVISEAAKFPELAWTFFKAGPEQGIGHLAAWLAEETRQGRLAVQDPEFAAEQFLTLCQTCLVLRRRLLLLDEAQPKDVERVVNASVAMFLKSYGVAPGP